MARGWSSGSCSASWLSGWVICSGSGSVASPERGGDRRAPLGPPPEDPQDEEPEEHAVDDEDGQGPALQIADQEPDREQAGHERREQPQAERRRLLGAEATARQAHRL